MKRHAVRRRFTGWSFLLVLTLASGVSARPPQNEDLSGRPERSASHRPRITATRLSLDYGAELITIYSQPADHPAPIPILSILRDTLGDEERENDLLRYVWIYTYAPPTLKQKIVAAIPFLYHSVMTRRSAEGPPPVALDLARPKRPLWEKASHLVLQNAVLDSKGWAFRALPRTLRQNMDEYREAQLAKALAILSLYRKSENSLLMPDEIARITSYLSQQSLLSAFLGDLTLLELTARELHKSRERRATNWDLLRQRAEEEGLFFEPLGPPGEPPSHALLWVSRESLREHAGRSAFNKRFLNIKSPWGDERLLQWSGYTKTIYLDQENRRVTPDQPGARPVELIPLALYGLDFPKIPILLADFRNTLNAKAREVSGRAIADSARYVLNFSPYRDLGYLLTRSLLNYVTRKKGIDVNQPSRLKAQAELSAVLLTDDQLDPHLKSFLARKAEKARASALENSFRYQPAIAARQHEALVRAATQEPTLARRVERDRQREYRKLNHGPAARVFLALAHILTAGLYTHREELTPELRARYDLVRRMAFHRARLEAALRDSIRLDEEHDLSQLRASVEFIRAHAHLAGSELVDLLKEALFRSSDLEFQWECVRTLAEIGSPKAQRALLAIERDPQTSPHLRDALSRERPWPEGFLSAHPTARSAGRARGESPGSEPPSPPRDPQ